MSGWTIGLLGLPTFVMPDLIRHPPSFFAEAQEEGRPRIKSGVTNCLEGLR